MRRICAQRFYGWEDGEGLCWKAAEVSGNGSYADLFSVYNFTGSNDYMIQSAPLSLVRHLQGGQEKETCSFSNRRRRCLVGEGISEGKTLPTKSGRKTLFS